MENEPTRVGIIGGSGLYDMGELTDVETISVETPFGAPSDEYVLGTLEGVRVAFLSRHGRGHRLSPSEINFRANIYGFKKIGAERLISISAVGSLKENIHPLDIVIPDQLFDHTQRRPSTFFGDGLVAHIAFADPMCSALAKMIYEASPDISASMHSGGTLISIEGPAFSTRAESNVYRQWGMDIIGMTSLQEAKLAREAEMCYATIAMVTDYDCWHSEEPDVSVESVVQTFKKNIATAKQIIRHVVPALPNERGCICARVLKNAIITETGAIPEQTRKNLDLLVGKYLEG